MKRGAVLFVVAGASVLALCGISKAGRKAPSVPSEVLRALCATFSQEEGFDAHTPLLVLSETRPIFNTFALRLAYSEGQGTPDQAAEDDARDAALRRQFVRQRITLPLEKAGCKWRLAKGSLQTYAGTQQLVLELSSPVEDPFAPPGGTPCGLFARHSLGGAAGASWYWIALDGKRVRRVLPLDVSDD